MMWWNTKLDEINNEILTLNMLSQAKGARIEALEGSQKDMQDELKYLKEAIRTLTSELKALEKSFAASSSSECSESVKRLELWRADLESKLFEQSAAGRPTKKSALFKKLRNAY